MTPRAWFNGIWISALLWLVVVLVILFLQGCVIRPLPLTARQERVDMDAAVFDETAPLAVGAPVDDVDVRRGVLDVSRLRAADINVYQPSFRILEDHRGRLRLIMQDPLTHRYKVVQ